MYKCIIFFHLHFAGDTSDIGDMKNLKIYTKIQVKLKFADLMTRQFNSRFSSFFWIFFPGDTNDIRKMYECPILFHLHFSGDTGDTGDMLNLKIYTKIQVK